MNPRLHALAQALRLWWSERPLRERLLVLAGATAVVLVAGDALVTAPAERRVKLARATVQTQQAQLDAARLAAAPGQSAQMQREQAQRLQQRVVAAREAAARLRQQAAEAARLPETLRAITATVGSARLLALELSSDTTAPPAGAATFNAAPGELAAALAVAAASAASGAGNGAVAFSTPAPSTPAPAPTAGSHLYRLPITLKVSGTYEELHMLLSQIERHAEALQWTSLTLDSSEWPAIQLTLKAHVLSPDPRWGAAS